MSQRLPLCQRCHNPAPSALSRTIYCQACLPLAQQAKKHAYATLAKAIRAGQLPPASHQLCPDCLAAGQQLHAQRYFHPNHEQPLDVIPLCLKHMLQRRKSSRIWDTRESDYQAELRAFNSTISKKIADHKLKPANTLTCSFCNNQAKIYLPKHFQQPDRLAALCEPCYSTLPRTNGLWNRVTPE